jgi:hypothetical protein
MRVLLEVMGVIIGIIIAWGIFFVYMSMPFERRIRLTAQEGCVFACFAGAAFLCVIVSLHHRKQRLKTASPARTPPQAATGFLDVALMTLTPSDCYRGRDFLAGGVCIMGKTGSGKTSSSGYQLGRALVSARTGGLILGSKPSDPQFWKGIFAAAGRSEDLLVFESGGQLTFDPIDFEMQHGADAHEITRYLLTIDETMARGQGGHGASNEKFWEGGKKRVTYNSVITAKLATGKVTVPDLVAFLNDAATNPAQLGDEAWRKGIHCQFLKRAMETNKSQADEHDYNQAFEFFTKEWIMMDAKVRASIMVDVMNTLHTLNSGEIRLLLSSSSNVSPAMMDQGKWILVNMPAHEKGAGGIAVNAAWKYSTQRHVLRRSGGTIPIIIWSDEYQNVANSFDAAYLGEARSHLSAMVILTQGLNSLFSAMKDGQGHHEAKALLSHFGLKVFHALGDSETATFASSLVGKAVTMRGGYSNRSGDKMQQMMGGGGITHSANEHMEEILQSNAFMHGLRCGGPPDCMADAIIVKAGEPFAATGGNYLKVAFSQR